jgi:hypothetical protein
MIPAGLFYAAQTALSLIQTVTVVASATIGGTMINGGLYAASTLISGQKWDWGQFGRSLAVGALSGATGAGAGVLTNGFQVYGAIPGALIEGGIKGTAGAISGGFTNVIMNRGWGDNGKNFWTGAAQGFTTGFVLGGISGGFKGYKNAQGIGASPWSGRLYNDYTDYFSPTGEKGGILLQTDTEKYCYGHCLEYASEGRNTGLCRDDFIKIAQKYGLDHNGGADVGLVARRSGLPFNWSKNIYGEQWDDVGNALQLGQEIMGTVPRGDVYHWVNLTRLTTANKWRIIGGGWNRVLYSTSIWDPIKGHVINGPINYKSIVSLF